MRSQRFLYEQKRALHCIDRDPHKVVKRQAKCFGGCFEPLAQGLALEQKSEDRLSLRALDELWVVYPVPATAAGAIGARPFSPPSSPHIPIPNHTALSQ